MTETAPNYYDLKVEDSWINYLRARLPYSFNHIEQKGRGSSRHFVLSEPVLLTGPLTSERHNYWRRGNVYYMSGKLLDYYSLPDVGQRYRTQAAIRLLTDPAAPYVWPINAFAFYNSMQMEKVWGFAQSNHLDRERVMMTNVAQAVELCLKAAMAHANFRKTNCFRFSAGHNISKLYAELPCSLRDKIAAESKVFAKEYVAFRTLLEADFPRVLGHPSQPPPYPADAMRKAEADWNQIANRIRESSYTAFVNSNDPGASHQQLHEDWFNEALTQAKHIEGYGDLIEYLRYAPLRDKDELPIPLVNSVLLLGRFMYEHLFPVPPSGNGPLSGFPLR